MNGAAKAKEAFGKHAVSHWRKVIGALGKTVADLPKWD
jgi:hypothetical protein